ncbi:MAG: aromatic ring-hydroxylating dioxygenase subunit alpha [Candidatus Melainabacteria bacterium HGW-Melainabacteria-1]|nr:MAG: aromatic ring-hydroxylating dioxygenase subunit alpha [Candidatus Melainabacteria bacterium HGW-Melainabacteria-1]
MAIRSDQQNPHTQPRKPHPVFNNWDVVTEGWYIVCRSAELGPETVLSRNVNQQRICVWRAASGRVYAMDGFCPHMGVDLGIGKVVGERLRCFFHHWEYGADGHCKHIPIQSEIPARARLQTYACQEAYGFVWVHPDPETQTRVLEVPSLEGRPVTWRHGKVFERSCHYHITMINGIDPQHLRTVHGIHMDMELSIEQAMPHLVDIELSGKTPETTPIEKLVKKVLGPRYAYSMKYADGCVAALTTMKGVSFFGRTGILPEMHMLFAYQLLEPGRVQVQPIYVTLKRPGLGGWLAERLCLWMTKMGFYALQGEDGKVYDNISFNTQNLLAMDAPVARYVQYINRLKPSRWSRRDLGDGETALRQATEPAKQDQQAPSTN